MEHGEFKPRKIYKYNYYIKREKKPKQEPTLNIEGEKLEVRFYDAKSIPRKWEIKYFNLPYEQRLKIAEQYLDSRRRIFQQIE